MAENSAISWTTHTFNPWIGCTKVSPACAGCYAEALMNTRYGRVSWGPGEDRQRTASATWRQPLGWNRKAVETGARPFVFCASLADVFDNEVDPLWRRDLFVLIEATPRLVWLLLTKRIGNVLRMTDPLHSNPLVPANAAVGATMANQEEYDRDAPKLVEVRRVRKPLFTFGSFEPLLGPVMMNDDAPDWIITGGETHQGQHRARPSHPQWFRDLRDQSAALGRVYHHKQNGEWVQHYPSPGGDLGGDMRRGIVQQVRPFGEHDGHFRRGDIYMRNVGKKAAGRLLDGVEHNGMPQVATESLAGVA